MYWNGNANYWQDGTAGLTLTWDVLKFCSGVNEYSVAPD